VVKIHESVGRPNPLSQVFPRNHVAGVFQQDLQNLERLFLQPDLGPVAPQFSRILIQFELSEPDDGS
jgi:hypothetical protein